MRLIAIILTAFVASGPAAAQSWTEYSYPEDSFTVSFPAPPKVETTTQQGPDSRPVTARVYLVPQDHAAFKVSIVDLSNAAFKVSIVDLSNPALEENAVIDYAIRTLSQRGEVKLDIPARINRVYGRQLSIAGADGSHSSAAVFYVNGRL